MCMFCCGRGELFWFGSVSLYCIRRFWKGDNWNELRREFLNEGMNRVFGSCFTFHSCKIVEVQQIAHRKTKERQSEGKDKWLSKKSDHFLIRGERFKKTVQNDSNSKPYWDSSRKRDKNPHESTDYWTCIWSCKKIHMRILSIYYVVSLQHDWIRFPETVWTVPVQYYFQARRKTFGERKQ